MNIGIIIFEKEDYLFKLLKFRLSTYFPDGYIVRGNSGGINPSDIPLAKKIHVLYDSDQYTSDQISRECNNIDIPISISTIYNDEFNKGRIIDCKYLARKIMNQSKETSSVRKGSGESDSFNGKLIMIISYAYMDERENLIDTEFDYLRKDSHMCLRIDLMSGIRMPSSFSGLENSTGGITDILRLAASESLEPKDIMAYSTPGTNGFITPGKPVHTDDVFDFGINPIINLIETSKELTTDITFPINVLIVAEGFKFKDIVRISGMADELHFLLPERLLKDYLGFKSEIGSITRSLPPEVPVTMHYCDNIIKSKRYETTKI